MVGLLTCSSPGDSASSRAVASQRDTAKAFRHGDLAIYRRQHPMTAEHHPGVQVHCPSCASRAAIRFCRSGSLSSASQAQRTAQRGPRAGWPSHRSRTPTLRGDRSARRGPTQAQCSEASAAELCVDVGVLVLFRHEVRLEADVLRGDLTIPVSRCFQVDLQPCAVSQ